MTREELSELFVAPDAAVVLLPLAAAHEPSELRSRAAAALACLDPDLSIPWTLGPLGPAVQAITETLAAVLYSASRPRRLRAAGLLSTICALAAEKDDA